MDRDRIAALLASGIPATGVATIVGLSPARITQIQSEESFQELLKAKQVELQDQDKEEISLSGKYLNAEHALLTHITNLVAISDIGQATAALRVIAERQEKAKMRKNPIHQGVPVINNVVQLLLPQHAVPEIAYSSSKEVIAVENRNLAPLSSQGVLSLFKSMDTTQREPVPLSESTGTTVEEETNDSQASSSSTESSTAKALPIEQVKKLGAAFGALMGRNDPIPFALSN